MQIVPIAVNRQEPDTLLLWDPNPELSLLFPAPRRSFMDYHWGAGTLDGELCFILYLFGGEHAIEVYFPKVLPTSPEHQVNVWDALLELRPEVLGIRYGERPADAAGSVSISFAQKDGEGLIDSLEAFLERTLRLYDEGQRDPVLGEIADHFRSSGGDTCPVQF